jgi:FHS family L-fucose permease-like MFS transporter
METRANPSDRFSFALVTLFFFIFGFLTCLNDILVPHLKALFTLTYTEATLVQFCFFSAYFFTSIPAGKILEKMGYKKGIVVGLVITAIGALGFYPAAEYRVYGIFLASFFVLASGITLLQVAVNPYITLLGPSHSAPTRLNLAQAFNSLGTAIAPTFGAVFFLSTPHAGPEAIQKPYLIFAAILVGLALVTALFKLPSHSESTSKTPMTDVQKKWLALGAGAIFCYVGAEVGVASFLVNWMGLPKLGSIDAVTAGKYVSFYWSGAMVGRFLGTPLLMRYPPRSILFGACVGAILMTGISMIATGPLSLWTILSVGLFNSIMFPTIFSLSLVGLDDHIPRASGILCTAIVGGAIFPLLQGVIADVFSLQMCFLIPILGYLYICYFAKKVPTND